MTESYGFHDIESWFIPGPIDVRREVLRKMSEPPYGHRVPDIMGRPVEIIRDGLFEVVGADENLHSMVLTGGSGTNALEMAVRSWGEIKGEEPKVLVPSIGLFGDLWVDIYRYCNVKVDSFRSPDGGVIDLNQLDDALARHHYDIVAVTHNDTSTGTLNPLADVAKVVRDRKGDDTMLFVDGVSSVGGTAINMTGLEIDFLATAPQKCLGVPPGLELAVVRNTALDRVQPDGRGYADDVIWQTNENRKNMTLTTPPLAQIGALALQLEFIVDEEGIENRFSRHAKLAAMTREWGESEGFSLLPDLENSSPTVTCFVNDREVDLKGIQHQLRLEGYGFDAGHPKLTTLREKKGLPGTFRVAHMGDRTATQLKHYLDLVSSVLVSYS